MRSNSRSRSPSCFFIAFILILLLEIDLFFFKKMEEIEKAHLVEVPVREAGVLKIVAGITEEEIVDLIPVPVAGIDPEISPRTDRVRVKIQVTIKMKIA